MRYSEIVLKEAIKKCQNEIRTKQRMIKMGPDFYSESSLKTFELGLKVWQENQRDLQRVLKSIEN